MIAAFDDFLLRVGGMIPAALLIHLPVQAAVLASVDAQERDLIRNFPVRIRGEKNEPFDRAGVPTGGGGSRDAAQRMACQIVVLIGILLHDLVGGSGGDNSNAERGFYEETVRPALRKPEQEWRISGLLHFGAAIKNDGGGFSRPVKEVTGVCFLDRDRCGVLFMFACQICFGGFPRSVISLQISQAHHSKEQHRKNSCKKSLAARRHIAALCGQPCQGGSEQDTDGCCGCGCDHIFHGVLLCCHLIR